MPEIKPVHLDLSVNLKNAISFNVLSKDKLPIATLTINALKENDKLLFDIAAQWQLGVEYGPFFEHYYGVQYNQGKLGKKIPFPKRDPIYRGRITGGFFADTYPVDLWTGNYLQPPFWQRLEFSQGGVAQIFVDQDKLGELRIDLRPYKSDIHDLALRLMTSLNRKTLNTLLNPITIMNPLD